MPEVDVTQGRQGPTGNLYIRPWLPYQHSTFSTLMYAWNIDTLD